MEVADDEAADKGDSSRNFSWYNRLFRQKKRKLAIIGLGILLSLLSGSSIAEWSTRGQVKTVQSPPPPLIMYPVKPLNETSMTVTFNTSEGCPDHQFKLSPYTRLNVCRIDTGTVVDFRRFLNNKPTIKGITISMKEWKMLLRMLPFIRREIRTVNQAFVQKMKETVDQS